MERFPNPASSVDHTVNAADGVVHIVDDDEDMLDSLRTFLAAHWITVNTYRSAEEFLGQSNHAPGCLLVDLRMPGIGGLGLIERLAAEGRPLPTVVLTAHGDVPTAVRAMKLGAVDFLAKPHDSRDLLRVIKAALTRGVEDAAGAVERKRLAAALESLTPREREILLGVVAGQSSRSIAAELGLQPKSVEVYRGRVLNKLGYSTSLELVRAVLSLNVDLTPPNH